MLTPTILHDTVAWTAADTGRDRRRTDVNEVRGQLFGLLTTAQKAAFAAVRDAMVADPKALDNHSRKSRQEQESHNAQQETSS